MVEKIYDLKNLLIEQAERDAREKGASRLDPELIDGIKDLAAAEKDCWEAEYYRSVSEAMEGSGYSGDMMGYNGSMGAQTGSRGSNGREWSQNGSQSGSRGYRDSMGRYARRGYGSGYQEHVDALRMELQNADQQEREHIMQELRAMTK